LILNNNNIFKYDVINNKMIEKEFKDLEDMLARATTLKSLKVVLRIARNKLRAILREVRLSKIEKSGAIRAFKRFKNKVAQKIRALK
jgi:hypothetical protein